MLCGKLIIDERLLETHAKLDSWETVQSLMKVFTKHFLGVVKVEEVWSKSKGLLLVKAGRKALPVG